MITLYDYELSAECYTARLMLSILGLRYQTVAVDIYPGDDNRADWFLKLNPLGEVPVLQDSVLTLYGPQAIIAYLARRYDTSGLWHPLEDAPTVADVATWLDFAGRLERSAGAARLDMAFFTGIDLAAAQAEAHRLLRILDEHLWFAEKAGRNWLAEPDHPTIADIAAFPHVMLSEEGGISRQDYPAIRRWCDRVRRVSGFTVMSGIFPTAPAKV